MYILAGLVNPEERDDVSGCFQTEAGQFYDFKFQVLEDQQFIRFYDSVGRMVPVDFSELRDIAEMFARIHRYVAKKKCVTGELLDELANTDTWLDDEIREYTFE